MLIPADNKLPASKSILIKAFYHPHFEVGGDYYDCLALNDHVVGFCIADVSGKGISAAILMSNFQANLKALFTHGTPLPQLVEELNQRVMESANGEKFITLFIGQFDSKTKKLDYINAGHNPPLLFEKKKKEMTLLGNGCVGMGMLDQIPVIETGHKIIEEPTKLLCYTDGLIELVDENGVEFGTKNIERLLFNQQTIDKNIDEIIVEQKILTGSTAIFDDITILGLEFIP